MKGRNQRNQMKRIVKGKEAELTMFLGGLLISVGCGMIYRPAGRIAAGLLTIAAGVLAALAGEWES